MVTHGMRTIVPGSELHNGMPLLPPSNIVLVVKALQYKSLEMDQQYLPPTSHCTQRPAYRYLLHCCWRAASVMRFFASFWIQVVHQKPQCSFHERLGQAHTVYTPCSFPFVMFGSSQLRNCGFTRKFLLLFCSSCAAVPAYSPRNPTGGSVLQPPQVG